MSSVPFLGRMRWIDYQRLVVTLLILVVESVLRFTFYLIPFGLLRRLNPLSAWWSGGAKKEDNEDVWIGEGDTTTEMIRAHGYGVEEHTVITSDGYLLVLHRIKPRMASHEIFTPESSSSSTIRSAMRMLYRHQRSTNPMDSLDKDSDSRPPVLAMHGLLMTSEVWVMCRSPNRSIAFALCDAGYDVWLANRRGNKYSHKHLQLKSNSDAYWDFSLDQTALLDIPCLVEYVLKETGYSNLTYLGFSQGNAEGMAALSLSRALNDRINLMVSLAPMTKPREMPNVLVQSLCRASPELLFLLFGKQIFLRSAIFWRSVLSRTAYSRLLDYCMWWLFGWSCAKLSAVEKPWLYAHLFSYTGTKMIVHWFQVMRSGRFQMYDDTTALLNPGHIPPSLPIEQVACPIAVFLGGRDTLCDAEYLLGKCAERVVEVHRVAEYEHLDFIWADDVQEQITPRLLELLSRLQARPQAAKARRSSKNRSRLCISAD